MKPSNKSDQMNEFLDIMTKNTFGRSRSESIKNNICVICGKSINPETEFKTELDKKEYVISGLCQACQDDTFKPHPEDDYSQYDDPFKEDDGDDDKAF